MMKLKLPLIIVNFKAYEEAMGKNALRLAKLCRDVAKKYKVNIAIAPQFCDIFRISQKFRDLPIFSQHIDPIEQGKFTGHISALSVKIAGAIGSLINHSERKLKLNEIKSCIEIAKKNNLISVCCAASAKEAEKIAKFNPDFIAIEPPELIGTGIAVSKAKPELVTKSIKKIQKVNKNIKVLCGAGISSGKDVEKALELGTCGIIVASAIVKAKNPKKVLKEFALAIK